MSWRERRSTDRANMDYIGTRYWIGSPNFGRRSGRIVYVVIHTTQGPAVDEGPAVNKFLNTTASIHYIVNRQGEITQMVRDANAAFHVGGSIHYWANQEGIGIEHVNRRGLSPPDDMYRASARLVRWLCDQYGIPKSRPPATRAAGIKAHEDVSPNRKSCPGPDWAWDHFLRLVNA